MSYTHLTSEERYHIAVSRKAGLSLREIASQLGRHPSSLSREIRRNTGLRGYRPKQAQWWRHPYSSALSKDTP